MQLLHQHSACQHSAAYAAVAALCNSAVAHHLLIAGWASSRAVWMHHLTAVASWVKPTTCWLHSTAEDLLDFAPHVRMLLTCATATLHHTDSA
jgi:hypothetical protein